jgi:hypothetical protein
MTMWFVAIVCFALASAVSAQRTLSDYRSLNAFGTLQYHHAFDSQKTAYCTTDVWGPQSFFWPIRANLDYHFFSSPSFEGENLYLTSFKWEGTLTGVVPDNVPGFLIFTLTNNDGSSVCLTCSQLASDRTDYETFGMTCNFRGGEYAADCLSPAQFVGAPVCNSQIPEASAIVGQFLFYKGDE